MNSIDFGRLIHSATYYLCYQDKIGRSFMINEASLKYPVADYLTGLKIPLESIEIEFPHPDLKQRSIDLVTKIDRMNKSDEDKIEMAFEFKIAKQVTKYQPEQKRVFNDLMRLCLIGQSKSCSCYFLITGTQADFVQNFRSIVDKRPIANSKDLPLPQGFYTEWFKFKVNGEQIFDVKNASVNQYKNIYKAFLNDYKPKTGIKNLNLPDRIKTKCIAISPLSREFPIPYVGGIWQVEYSA